MTDLSPEQRRTLVALSCKVAWADGVVTEEEREHVRRLAFKVAADHISDGEVDDWLDTAPPDADLVSLPESMRQLFFYDAMALMEADGDLADAELELLEEIMGRVFSAHPEGVTLGRITLRKKRPE